MKAILESHAVQQAVAEILVTLIATLAALIAASSPLIVRWFRAKGVEVSEAEARLFETAVKNGAAFAEEWATGMVKKTGTTPAGHEKLDVAVTAAKQLARDKLAAWTDQQLRTAIQAKLPELRAKTAPPPAPVDHDTTQIYRPL